MEEGDEKKRSREGENDAHDAHVRWMQGPQPKRAARVAEREELLERLSSEFLGCGFPKAMSEEMATAIFRRTKSLQHIAMYWSTAVRRCSLLREVLRPIQCDDLTFELQHSFPVESEAILRAIVNTKMTDDVFQSRIAEFKAAVEPNVVTDPEEKRKKDIIRVVNRKLAALWPREDLEAPCLTRDRADESHLLLQKLENRIALLKSMCSGQLPVDGLFLWHYAMDVSFPDCAWECIVERLQRVLPCLAFPKAWQVSRQKAVHPVMQRRVLEFVRDGTHEEWVSRLVVLDRETKEIYVDGLPPTVAALEEFAETGVDTTIRALNWMWQDLFDGVRQAPGFSSADARRSHCRKATLSFILCWRASDQCSPLRLLDRNVMLLIARMAWESQNIASAKWSIFSWVERDSVLAVLRRKFPPPPRPPPPCRNCYAGPGYCMSGCGRGYCTSCCWGCNRYRW